MERPSSLQLSTPVVCALITVSGTNACGHWEVMAAGVCGHQARECGGGIPDDAGQVPHPGGVHSGPSDQQPLQQRRGGAPHERCQELHLPGAGHGR